MDFAVLKGATYCLVYTTDMILHNGTTQTVEKYINPNSEYLKNIKDSYRTYEKVVNYGPKPNIYWKYYSYWVKRNWKCHS